MFHYDGARIVSRRSVSTPMHQQFHQLLGLKPVDIYRRDLELRNLMRLRHFLLVLLFCPACFENGSALGSSYAVTNKAANSGKDAALGAHWLAVVSFGSGRPLTGVCFIDLI